VIISIDLGGTKMLATLMDREYQVVDSDKIRTPQTTDGGEILSLMLESIRKLMNSAELGKEDVTGVAVGVPSAVDFKRGIVLSATNIGFEHYPLRDRLTEELGVPVLVENDVNAGLYGESAGAPG
jgi:glucokinase